LREWQRALRNGRPLALGVLDVDHFKKYNDHYGHQAGDACLQRVAGILAETVHRAGDTVARYGGEEFVVLLPESDGAGAWQFAEKIRLAVETAALPHAQSPNGIVSVSIGVKSLVPSETDASSQLVRLADEALYEAKRQGRNKAILAS
ncbi:MAG: GGDEF domain-containing protein, partial [Pleurocapsa sp. SU_196_0]|nr:GGDEF domain-containing protein [Pleurocapsa sp. SU_196_0]